MQRGDSFKLLQRPAGSDPLPAHRSTTHAACIEVQNNSIRMSADQTQHLFEPFNRLGQAATPGVGEGLGLALPRELVAAMEGSIAISSEPGRGIRVSLTLSRHVSG